MMEGKEEVLLAYSGAATMKYGMEGAADRIEIAKGLLAALTEVMKSRDDDKIVHALIQSVGHELDAGRLLLDAARDVLANVF